MNAIYSTTGDSDIDTGCPVCGNNGCPDCGEPDRAAMHVRTTTETLALARTEIHDAVAAHDDAALRRQCAQAAHDYAATVLLAGDATETERRHARCYLDDANGMLATTY